MIIKEYKCKQKYVFMIKNQLFHINRILYFHIVSMILLLICYSNVTHIIYKLFRKAFATWLN